jgi:hypothetical protein
MSRRSIEELLAEGQLEGLLSEGHRQLVDLVPEGMEIYAPVPTGELYAPPVFPENGYPPRPYEDRPALSPWGRLLRGQNAGQKTVIKYNNALNTPQFGNVPMMQLAGDDMDAQALVLTISPPSVIPIAYADLPPVIDQNTTGETSNMEAFNVNVGDFPGTDEPVAFPPIQVELEWGVGGTYQRAIVDAINGATVNVVASFVKARAFIFTPSSRGIDGTAAAYVLGAHLGPGWHSSPGAQCTTYIGAIESQAESAPIPVPPFARRAYVYGCDGRAVSTPAPDTTTANLRFWQSKNGSAAGLNVGNALVTANQPGPFLVPNGAQYASVTNGTGDTLLYSIVYELSI